PPKPPKITGVEVIAAQPTEAESAAIESHRLLRWVGGHVNDVLIPKYWEYNDGVYFTVLDPQFFADHKRKRLRFSQDRVDFYDSGGKAPSTSGIEIQKKAVRSKAPRLPLQADVLK